MSTVHDKTKQENRGFFDNRIEQTIEFQQELEQNGKVIIRC